MPRCHDCDEYVSVDDRYCPECGVSLRRRRRDYYDDDFVRSSSNGSNGLATASFVVASIGGLLWIAFLMALLSVRSAPGPRSAPILGVFVVGVFVAVILHAVGLGLGIAGTLKESRNKWMAVFGLIVSIVGLIAFVILIIVGISNTRGL